MAAAVELRDVSKRFGAVLANDGVTLRIAQGTIHAIIGENGAGKSTAMNIVYGLHRPDSGEVLIDGALRQWRSPSEAIAAGLGMIHQHFVLAGQHTALENIIIGAENSRCGFLNRKAARARIESIAAQYDLEVELERPVDELPVGMQQRVEILKLLYRGARILILDEPTAVLTPQQSDKLFQNLIRLRDEGKTIILVTHKLREVLGFSQRVSVLRQGRVVGQLNTAEASAEKLAELMVGRKVNLRAEIDRAPTQAECALEVQELSLQAKGARRRKLDGLSLRVKRGEIVGIAGVEGNGQSELVEALLHPQDPRCRTGGEIRIGGVNVTKWPAAKIRELGVAFIPEDRQHQGLLLDRSLRENFALGLHRAPRFSHGGLLRWAGLSQAAREAMTAFDVRSRDLQAQAKQLSGGNQQKVILAREFCRDVQLLLAAQPTRGVDVGAIEFIRRRILETRNGGAGVLLISFDLEEILALSDRILVLFEGRIVGEFLRGEVSESQLGLKMGGMDVTAGAAEAR